MVDYTQGDFIHLHSGHRFYLDQTGKPMDGVAEIDIEDIALGLATKCRFNGQLGCFYSVAQHSYIMSRIVPPDWALEGLLHDAEEVYWCDMPRPWKLLMPDIAMIGDKITAHIWKHFGLHEMPEQLHDIDTCLGHTEAWFLGGQPNWVRASYIIPEAKPLLQRSWEWREAEEWFLRRFTQLQDERDGHGG